MLVGLWRQHHGLRRRIELLDAAGNPIAGYTQEEADDIVADQTQTISWKGKRDIGDTMRQPVRLRFHLYNANLYSFRFAFP